MKTKTIFEGAATALVTPLTAEGIDYAAFARLIDWQKDFDLMVGPINHILNTEIRALPYLHWHTFLSAYMEIPPESVFARVLRIREKLRTGKKLEKYERSWYKKNIDLVNIKPKYSKAENDQYYSDNGAHSTFHSVSSVSVSG